MRKKKKYTGLIAGLLLMILLAGCGSNQDSVKETPKDEQDQIRQSQKENGDALEEEMDHQTADGYSSMADINSWCQDKGKEEVKAVLEQYQQFSALESYSSEDGVLVYSYTFRKEQKYDMSAEEVANAYKENMEKGKDNLLATFELLKNEGIRLKGIEYHYFNPDGAMVCDLYVTEDPPVTTKQLAKPNRICYNSICP